MDSRGGVGDKGSFFKEKDELVKIFEEQKIPKYKELVCYCALGHRAANVFTQIMIADCENVKLYDGSLADWVEEDFLSDDLRVNLFPHIGQAIAFEKPTPQAEQK